MKIPPQYVPKTILIKASASEDSIIEDLNYHGLTFPVIFKPDIGERGHMVKRIHNEADILRYRESMPHDFIAQELVDLPLEFGIFYTRFPDQQKGSVTSIVRKEMLSVTGDGTSSLQQLILQKQRARLQWKKLKVVYQDRLQEVLPKGQHLEIVSIGNHCLGTKFINGCHLINMQLNSTFDAISKQIDGFYFGRYDLRCKSLADLYEGKVMIMELNGCGAEPAHIYHPGFPLVKAMHTLFTHWKNIFTIARQNAKGGTPYIPFREAIHHYRKFKSITGS